MKDSDLFHKKSDGTPDHQMLLPELSDDEIQSALKAWEQGNDEPLDLLFIKLEKPLKAVIHLEIRKPSWRNIVHLTQTTEVFQNIFEILLKKWREKSPNPTKRNLKALVGILARRILIQQARKLKPGRMTVIDERETQEIDSSNYGQIIFSTFERKRAIAKLSAANPVLATIAELYLDGGFTHAEIAEALSLPNGSMHRLWKEAKLFLAAEMGQ